MDLLRSLFHSLLLLHRFLKYLPFAPTLVLLEAIKSALDKAEVELE